MANKVDVLFESVLGALGAPLDQGNASDFPWIKEVFEKPFEDQDDLVQSMDGATDLRTMSERLTDDQSAPSLTPDEQEAAEAGIRCRGFDVLAFYKSRRHIDQKPYKGKWGIFYLRQGLQFIAGQIAKEHPGYGRPWSLRLR